MYVEEDDDMSAISFYHYCNDIPEEYNVSEDIYDTLLGELMEINRNLRLTFKEMEEPTWVAYIFRLDSDWNFQIEYIYEQDESVGFFERELRWAYDELGIVPEGDFGKKLLDEYLEEKENR